MKAEKLRIDSIRVRPVTVPMRRPLVASTGTITVAQEYIDWANPILQEPARVVDGRVVGAAGAGLGMKWDEKAVRKYAA